MTKLLFVGIGIMIAAGLVLAEDKKADERVKVEVMFASEHVPKDLKAGTRVDLKMVTGKTVGPKNLTVYSTSQVVANVEVASVVVLDKPASPEAAVKVQLLVAKEKAENVEKTRDSKVTVVERQADGTMANKQKPITLRLELPSPEKK